MRFDATLQTAAGYNFQLVLVGPANLQVDNVSLLEDGVQRVTRFSQDDAGRITVFLSGPLPERKRWRCKARFRWPRAAS